MKMTFSTTFWKYALLAINTLISLAGVVLISCGVVALGGAGSTIGAYVVTSLGSFVLCLCFLGCFASIRESYVLSIIFVAAAVISIIAQTVLMIAFAILKDDFMDMAQDRIDNLWEKEQKQPGAMNAIQLQYSCCGKTSAQDYLLDDDDVLPKSCCLNSDCSIDENIFSKGCANVLLSFFDSHSDNIILINVGLIILEVLGLTCAYYLSKFLQAEHDKKLQRNTGNALLE